MQYSLDYGDSLSKDMGVLGIVTGYDENTFGPDTLVTREQMAVMVVRALGLATDGVPGASFTDADAISTWARAAIDAAVQNQVLTG
jgi:hypothetical protein